MKKEYIINHGEQTITITKAFAARAADISTREYRELTKRRRHFHQGIPRAYQAPPGFPGLHHPAQNRRYPS